MRRLHPKDFFNSFELLEPNMPSFLSEDKEKKIRETHPMSIVSHTSIKLPILEVRFSYLTKRGNSKTSSNYVVLQQMHEDVYFEVELLFLDKIEAYNQEHPYRAMENVKILSIDLYSYAAFDIGA